MGTNVVKLQAETENGLLLYSNASEAILKLCVRNRQKCITFFIKNLSLHHRSEIKHQSFQKTSLLHDLRGCFWVQTVLKALRYLKNTASVMLSKSFLASVWWEIQQMQPWNQEYWLLVMLL